MATIIDKKIPVVVYLSLEIALDNRLKTYAGGLGVLAGDILKSAANLKFPMVGVSLINRHGYFRQTLNEVGQQEIFEDQSAKLPGLRKLSVTTTVTIRRRQVKVGVWQYDLQGPGDFSGPVYFLDTDFPENTASDRRLTDDLYGGDAIYRLKQEIILGRAGLKILTKLGYEFKKIHVNETPGILAALELYRPILGKSLRQSLKGIRRQLVFTTHTPLHQAKDTLPKTTLLKYQPNFPAEILKLVIKNGRISLVSLAVLLAGRINAVSKLHQQVSKKLLKTARVKSVTNGVNSAFWTSQELGRVYDQYLAGWRITPALLERAGVIPLEEIWSAHQAAKKKLLNFIGQQTGEKLSFDALTIGFARRFTTYKRSLLLFSDLRRLRALSQIGGGLQIIYSGKAHPEDQAGQEMIKKLFFLKQKLKSQLTIVFLPNYDLEIAKLLTAGVDLWLNTPRPPLEASGTSGMKAAHNGVPQLSTYDGWWPEGYVKNKTGWKIGEGKKFNLYELLEQEILPLYYNQPDQWRQIMRSTITKNAARFSTDRVVREYIRKMY
jgi:starch phosphorylase